MEDKSIATSSTPLPPTLSSPTLMTWLYSSLDQIRILCLHYPDFVSSICSRALSSAMVSFPSSYNFLFTRVNNCLLFLHLLNFLCTQHQFKFFQQPFLLQYLSPQAFCQISFEELNCDLTRSRSIFTPLQSWVTTVWNVIISSFSIYSII